MLGDDKTSTYSIISAGTVIQHYTIIKQIGIGGMGEVYLAEDSRLHRRVAIKFLPGTVSQDPDHVARFVREAQAAARLNHPNVIIVHDVGEHQGRPFFAMELVEGQSLHDVLHQKQLSMEEVLAITRQIAEGLTHAHSFGIIHRDIKSSNIVVSPEGRVKILDFGLAAVIGGERITRIGSTMGTIAYMSPEQIRGHNADQRSDLFSFGNLLYEMITGRLPFRRDNDAATMQAIITEAELAEPVSAYRPGISDDWKRIVDKALQKDPSMRYQTAGDMLADIKRLSHGGSTPSIKIVSNRKVLAVLPFENIGGGDQDYFADGITDEITSRLAKLRELTVISNSSAQQYKKTQKRLKDIGHELGAGYLLQGTIRWERMGDVQRIRLSARLIRVDDESYLWVESYDRVLDQIFTVQSDIAGCVADALGIALMGKQETSRPTGGTQNLQAYDHFLKANEKAHGSLRSQDLIEAIRLYRKAIEMDENFALAHARLAGVLTAMYHFHGNHRVHSEQAKNAIDRALELAPTLPEAKLSLGYWYFHVKDDFQRAIEQFQSVLAVQPSNTTAVVGLAYVHRRQGQWKLTTEELKRAIELDPRNPEYPHQLAVSHLLLRQFDEGLRSIDRALWLKPEFGDNYEVKAWLTLGLTGNFETAVAVCREAVKKASVPSIVSELEDLELILGAFDNDPNRVLNELSIEETDPTIYLMYKAQLMGLLGRQEAREAYLDSLCTLLLQQLQDRPDSSRALAMLGLVNAMQGKREQALALAQQAAEARPLSRDALFGLMPLEFLARIHTALGDYDEAVDVLDRLLRIPSPINPSVLATVSSFRPLHNHPRFRELAQLDREYEYPPAGAGRTART